MFYIQPSTTDWFRFWCFVSNFVYIAGEIAFSQQSCWFTCKVVASSARLTLCNIIGDQCCLAGDFVALLVSKFNHLASEFAPWQQNLLFY